MINFEKLHKSYSLFCFYKLGCSIIKLSLTDLFTTERLAYMKEIFLMWRRHSCASVVKIDLVTDLIRITEMNNMYENENT